MTVIADRPPHIGLDPREYRRIVRHRLRRRLTGGRLRVHEWTDAVVVPVDLDGRPRSGGVITRRSKGWHHEPVSGLRRIDRETVMPVSAPVEATQHIPSAIYGGWLIPQYGHFLLESLARLWPEDLDEREPIVWIGPSDRPVPGWVDEILDLLGFRNERIVVTTSTGPLAVDRLVAPTPGFELRRSLHPRLAERLACVPASATPSRTTWLSRRFSERDDGLAEEADLEAALAERGWTVMHPEHLTVREQLRILADSSHVAGVEGSAFHSLVMLKDVRATVDIVSRRLSPNFDIIAQVTRWDQRRLEVQGGRAIPTELVAMSGQRVPASRWEDVDIPAMVEMLERSRHR